MRKDTSYNLLIVIALVVATLAVYARVTEAQFVRYDDQVYVTNNDHVKAGLTVGGVRWASAGYNDANWIPLTWMSLMVDHQLSGGAAAYQWDTSTEPASVYHRTNLIFHVLNVLLLFVVLASMTGCKWRSAVVAGLFAVHPLHVESVAWVAERKDVLSTFFGLLALWGYVWYARARCIGRYLAFALAFALGLMAKSMLVTLPGVMLLMDIWPLKRLSPKPSAKNADAMRLSQLVYEKLPLFAMSIAIGVVTMLAQKSGGATKTLDLYPMGVRLANAAVAGIAYLCKMFWPINLACFYPHPGHSLPLWEVAGSIALLLVLTAGAVLSCKKRPYLLVGWLWYVITILPVIGIIQVGSQAMADRYTYVPLIGLFVALVWGAWDLISKLSYRRVIAFGAAGVVLISLGAVAREQVGYWQDDYTLFEHAIAVTKDNFVAHYTLATRLAADERYDEAIEHYSEAARINPRDPNAYCDLGGVYLLVNRLGEARTALLTGLKLDPKNAMARINYGVFLHVQGNYDQAVVQYREALKYSPGNRTAVQLLQRAEKKQGPVPNQQP